MKLLFDENISYRVVKKLVGRFPESQPANRLNLVAKEDLLLWRYARENGFAIVTFDDDYEDLSQLLGWPPKVILLRTGNLSNQQIVDLILTYAEEIEQFLVPPMPSVNKGILKLFRIGS